MSLKLTWSIEGQTQLARRLEKIGSEIKDWTPAFKEASTKLKDVFKNDVFESKGAVIGERWAPLKPQYLAQKLKAGFPADPLIRTGAMRSRFDTEVKKDQATIGNLSPYFKYHQSKEPRSKLPRRIMMKLGNAQKEMVVKVFHTYWYTKTHVK